VSKRRLDLNQVGADVDNVATPALLMLPDFFGGALYPVQLRRNPLVSPCNKRTGPPRLTEKSFASSSLIVATTSTSLISLLRRSILAASSVSSTAKAFRVARTGNGASAA